MYFNHSMGLCVDAASEALRKIFYPKHEGEFEVVKDDSGVGIKSPYADYAVVRIEHGEMGNDIFLTPQAPYENADEVDAFENAVLSEIRDWEDRFIAN